MNSMYHVEPFSANQTLSEYLENYSYYVNSQYQTQFHNDSLEQLCHNCTVSSTSDSTIIMVLKSIILGIIVCLTIGGNVLVIIAVIISKNLRSSTHYLIVNLAVADLLLGTTVLPFSATLEVSHIWYFGQIFCEVWAVVDVLCCTASIWSLCVISIDRYIGVTRPLAYTSIMTEKRVCILIASVWILSISISIGPAFGWKMDPSPDPQVCSVNEELGYVLFSVIGSFYLPGFCIIAVYSRIYKAACKQSKFLESGIKTTSSEVTLRIHKGGSNSRKASTYSMSAITIRAHRGGSYSSQGIAESTFSNIEIPSHLRNGSSVSHFHPNHSDSRTRSKQYSDAVGEYSNYLHPENANNSNRRKWSGDSQCSTPERRISSIPAKLSKFKRQKKAAKTLGIVVGVFLLCWFPFFLILPLASLCTACRLPDDAFATFFWLGYFNSCLNPFIYACTSLEFKRAFQRILCQRAWFASRHSHAPTFSYASSIRRTPRVMRSILDDDGPDNELDRMWDTRNKASSHSSRSSCELEIKEMMTFQNLGEQL